MSTRLHVHLKTPFEGPAGDALRVLDHEVLWTAGAEVDPGATVLVGGRVTSEDLAGVRVLVIPFAGLPQRTRSVLLARPDVAVYNLHHNAPLVAELVLTLALAAIKRVVPMDRALRRGDWRPRHDPGQVGMLGGHRAVIVGFGAVGRQCARLLSGIGMHVEAVGRTGGVVDKVRVHGVEDLDAVLPHAGLVVLAVPHTPRTTGLIGAGQLALLADGSVLVNVARAAIVDGDALYDALATGRISAGLDVWWRYPGDSDEPTPPSTRPFASLDNVVMSPHRAGLVANTELLRARALVDVLRALARGVEPPGRVGVERGY